MSERNVEAYLAVYFSDRRFNHRTRYGRRCYSIWKHTKGATVYVNESITHKIIDTNLQRRFINGHEWRKSP